MGPDGFPAGSAADMRRIAESRLSPEAPEEHARGVTLALRAVRAAAEGGAMHALFRVTGAATGLPETPEALARCARHVGLELAKMGFAVEVFEPNQVFVQW